uniref:GTPase IMAP family member 8-like isoform X4 n=1 Tax=Oncorhynchus gorbuscha TaxID=8017 RepID=UPI001EAF2EE1|nr:GTPase IMAP family member 8-like isoform X4 [Oncorhynchus gorbuscha]
MESQGEGYPPFSVSTGGDESMQGVMQKEVNPSTSAPPLPELRLVLLGRKGTGKSSAANTILGGIGGFESGRPTEECSKKRADLTRRRVTVVDTPGWEWYYPLNSTPDWVRRETLRSMSLCSPGPHVILLVIRSCASVTESYRKQIEEHLESLGEGVLDHTMLLFTRGDELGVVPMEQRILTGGAAFQQLLRRCGNRYHVLDNRSRGDGTQVRELLRKMVEMVENKGGHFGADPALLRLEADGRRRARERRKRQRQMEAQTQRGTIRAVLMTDAGSQGSDWDGKQPFSKGTRRLPELRLVLLGERETGKSSAGNTILGGGGEGAGFFQTGRVTEECARCQAEVAMRLVTVVDTPGWEGGVAGPTPERVKREMVWGSVSLCPPGPHAVLLTLRVDTLVSSTPVREHLELLGEEVWRHAVLLFTHGDQLREGVGIEQHIQSGGRDLKWLVEKCGSRYHVISNVNGRGDTAQVSGLLEKVEKMVAGNRCEAFSSLVQEVSDLTRQRNEKFNQRLKEVGDKMQRQEMELKRMREREVKSIRWFFDRKKKVKSPGKSGVEKEEDGGEEEEEKRSDGRKNEMGELEERIRWLTEDKEREIQDLGAENYRFIAALNQRSREREEIVIKLEEREREIDELKERVDEQQVKLLDLERVIGEKERDKKEREEEFRGKHQEWRREAEDLKERIALEEKEKEEWIGRGKTSQNEMYESKQLYEERLLQYEEEMQKNCMKKRKRCRENCMKKRKRWREN